jgi:hypothetical protein
VKRFLVLWFLLLVVGLAVSVPLTITVTHNFDLRFEPFLTTILAPAVGALLLLLLMPPLRDRQFVAPSTALRRQPIANLAGVLVVTLGAVATLRVLRVLPPWGFDLLRGVLAIAAAIGFAAAWWKTNNSVSGSVNADRTRDDFSTTHHRRIAGFLPAAALFALLGITSGQLHRIAEHVFPSQPLAFRWLIFFGLAAIFVLSTMFRAVECMRDSAPDAATLLEWSLAPATLASVIVIGNIFWRPYLTPSWEFLANVLGIAAVALALLASLAAARGNT